jgi:type I restriction enzyme S subunit
MRHCPHSRTAKLFPSEFVRSEKGEIPQGWRVGKVGEFVDLQRGATYKSGLKGAAGPVLLGLGTIQRHGGFREDKLVTYGGDSPEKLLVAPGELFVSLKDVTQSADLLGAVARVPRHVKKGRLTQDTVKLVFKGSADIGELLYQTLLTQEYRDFCRQHATGTTNLGLSREDFLSYPVVVCPPSILAAFNEALRPITSRMELQMRESNHLASLRDTLLPRLLSGELSVAAAETAI